MTKYKELTGTELEDWQFWLTCPACDGGDLQSLPDDGRSGGVMFTDYECLDCGAEVSHIHNQRVTWPE